VIKLLGPSDQRPHAVRDKQGFPREALGKHCRMFIVEAIHGLGETLPLQRLL